MNRHDIRRLLLSKTRRETTLVYMRHRHDENPIILGTVPYHLNERGPGIPIQQIEGEPVLTFNGVRYEIIGYGIQGKTNGIVGPWPPPSIRLETGADEIP